MKVANWLWEILRNNIFAKKNVFQREKTGKRSGKTAPVFFVGTRKAGSLELADFL